MSANNLINIGMERAVLGLLLRSQPAFYQIEDRLKADNFATPLHRDIFSVIRDVCNEGKRLTITLAASRLPEEAEDGQSVQAYLSALIGSDGAEAAMDFVDDIIELSNKRRTIAIANQLIKEANDLSKNSEDTASRAEVALIDIRQFGSPKRPKLMSELVHEVVRGAEVARKGGSLPGFSTGINQLDEILGLIIPGDLGCILASSGDGKSALASQIGMYIAQQAPVLMIQMEMSGQTVAARELSALSGMSCGKVQEGAYDFFGLENIRKAEQQLQKQKFWIYEERSLTVRQIRTLSMGHKRSHGLNVLIIDQLDKIKGDGKYKDKFERVEMITADLKDLAKELGVVIILLDQRTREAKRRDDPVPRVTDSRFSSVEHDCDWLIGLWRHETWLQNNRPSNKNGYQQEGEALAKWQVEYDKSKGRAEIICLKRRRGRAFERRQLKWDGEITRFGEPIERALDEQYI